MVTVSSVNVNGLRTAGRKGMPEWLVASGGTERQQNKGRFMAAFLPYLTERREKAAAEGREVLVCGDWNIAHREADLRNWKANRASSGFLPGERAWLDQGCQEQKDLVNK
jgi:exonuclease III